MYTNDLRVPHELEGKTILSCEMIPAEHGRSARRYVLMVFTDNTRHIFAITDFCFHNPSPGATDMASTSFFSLTEIAEKEDREMARMVSKFREDRERDMRIYLRLKETLGIED